MKKFILSTLLHYANRSVPYPKDDFYALKSMLLERYGDRVDDDYQHITKSCYTCDGTGKYYGYRGIDICWHCCGTGIYSNFYVILKKYQFGKYQFHTPSERKYIYSDKDLPKVNFIQGYITHKTPKYYLATECGLWLMLFYNRRVFMKMMRSSCACGPIMTPLVFIQKIVWFFKWKEYRKWFIKKPTKTIYKNQDHQDIHELPF